MSSVRPADPTVTFESGRSALIFTRRSALAEEILPIKHECVCVNLTCFSPSILLSASWTASRYLKCSSMSLSTCRKRARVSIRYKCTETPHEHTTAGKKRCALGPKFTLRKWYSYLTVAATKSHTRRMAVVLFKDKKRYSSPSF